MKTTTVKSPETKTSPMAEVEKKMKRLSSTDLEKKIAANKLSKDEFVIAHEILKNRGVKVKEEKTVIVKPAKAEKVVAKPSVKSATDVISKGEFVLFPPARNSKYRNSKIDLKGEVVKVLTNELNITWLRIKLEGTGELVYKLEKSCKKA